MDNKKDKWDIEHDLPSAESSEETTKRESISTVEEIITGQLHKNLVVFAGPRETGKTVALMRLTHFLRKNRNTKVEPDRTYRNDARYQESVKAFLDDLHTPDFSPKRTGKIDFLVLDVFKGSEVFCQFLEAPGEAFFNTDDPHNTNFPPYLTKILNNHKLNKVFIFFFEENMLAKSDPLAYSKCLARLVGMMNRKKDDVIILYNKSDKLRQLYDRNKPNVREFKRRLYNNDYYGDFLGALKELGIPVKFVTFSSGDFSQIPGKDTERWTHSDDHYPDTLWRNITGCFKGIKWF